MKLKLRRKRTWWMCIHKEIGFVACSNPQVYRSLDDKSQPFKWSPHGQRDDFFEVNYTRVTEKEAYETIKQYCGVDPRSPRS